VSRWYRTSLRLLAAALPLALASCAAPLPRVDDIAFVRADLVQASGIPKQDRDVVSRAMDGPFLRITVTSSHDLQKLAHDWNYTLGYAAAACAGADVDRTKPLTGYGAVYDRHGPIYMYAERQTSGPGTPIRYHIYIAVKADYDLDRPTDAVQHSYDLAAHPQDICVRITGTQEVDGDGWGFAKFTSNVVKIPKAAFPPPL
jgi:hypothetical protein